MSPTNLESDEISLKLGILWNLALPLKRFCKEPLGSGWMKKGAGKKCSLDGVGGLGGSSMLAPQNMVKVPRSQPNPSCIGIFQAIVFEKNFLFTLLKKFGPVRQKIQKKLTF